MSSRSARVVITRTALEDIGEILQFTEEEWGSTQRERYVRLLEGVIERLAMMPLMGRSQDHLYPGVRSIPVGSHLLFYSYSNHIVYVWHLWHSRRDPGSIDWETLRDETDADF